jgi:hypothetical protein
MKDVLGDEIRTNKMGDAMFPCPGNVIIIQEVMGYLLGTVVDSGPLGVRLGADSIWARNLSDMTTAMETGQIQEYHHKPYLRVRDHAFRYWWPWPHKLPNRQKVKSQELTGDAHLQNSMKDSMIPCRDDVIIIQEVMGYILGTVIESGPWGVRLGSDGMWARNLSDMTTAMEQGTIQEYHHKPHIRVRDHAFRYWWPWPHKLPNRQKQ